MRLFWKIFGVYAATLSILGIALSTLLSDEQRAVLFEESTEWIGLGGPLSVTLGLLGAWGLTTRLIRRTRELRSAAQAIAEGQLDRRVAVAGRDEIGDLAETFNRMGERLADRFRELETRRRELEEHRERLATVLGGMVEGVVAVDDRERILFVNRAAHALLDFTGPTAVGRPIWEAVRHPTIQTVVRRALAGEGRQSIEFELPRRHAVVSLLASRLPGEPCPGVVLVLHDVTELRRLENLRREFVANVSHELKTPLTSIQAYAETLLNGAIEDPENNRKFLEAIEEHADRLHALILDLLRLARIESGKDVFDLTAVSLGEEVQSCLERHRTVAESKEITLTADPADRDVRVTADPDGLRSILDNLVDNAIKYTPPGGRVTVRWAVGDSTASIQVQDTGPGIREQDQARIFERFYRAEKARSRDRGGTGLGLAIVKHLTQVFGGRVELSSRVGEGSTFTVHLPLAAEQRRVE